MIGERTLEGFEIRLRSRGGGRYFGAAFLGFWLCGWAAGEAFAIWILFKGAGALLTGQPLNPNGAPLVWGSAVLMGLFLLLWLSIWTLGGFAALSAFLSLIWGEDRILAQSGRLTVRWSRGPFWRTRSFERDAIRRLLLTGRDDALSLELERERVEISSLGTRDERRDAMAALRAELGLPEARDVAAVPKAWEEIVTPEGERALVPNLATRRTQARVGGGFAMLLATMTLVIAFKSAQELTLMIPAAILLAFTIAVTAGVLWLVRGRMEWRIGRGSLTLRKRYGSNLLDVFEARRLVFEVTSDSDGDHWYELYALDGAEAATVSAPAKTAWRSLPKNRRTVARLMNDAATVRDLGRWLAKETGLPFEDRTTPEARELALAQLRDLLGNSGPFGKWAGKLVDHLAERAKKAG